MVTAIDRPTKPNAVETPGMTVAGTRVVLTGVSWEAYERLNDDFMDRSGPRFTFDQGTLEIISPTLSHDQIIQRLTYIVAIVSGQLGIPNIDAGSVTVRRPDMERGFEADSTFYFTNLGLMEPVTTTIDLAIHPPPDLVIEVDATHSSLAKLPLFAALGIPEVWRVADIESGDVSILVLTEGAYVRSSASRAIPVLTCDALTQLVADRQRLGSAAWFQHVLGWAQAQAKRS